jgi:hypothetical protein
MEYKSYRFKYFTLEEAYEGTNQEPTDEWTVPRLDLDLESA